jgi:hypothetical protein
LGVKRKLKAESGQRKADAGKRMPERGCRKEDAGKRIAEPQKLKAEAEA